MEVEEPKPIPNAKESKRNRKTGESAKHAPPGEKAVRSNKKLKNLKEAVMILNNNLKLTNNSILGIEQQQQDQLESFNLELDDIKTDLAILYQSIGQPLPKHLRQWAQEDEKEEKEVQVVKSNPQATAAPTPNIPQQSQEIQPAAKQSDIEVLPERLQVVINQKGQVKL